MSVLLCLCCSLSPPTAPDVSLFGEVIGDAFALAVVGYAISISLGKTFALKHGYNVDSNQVTNSTHQDIHLSYLVSSLPVSEALCLWAAGAGGAGSQQHGGRFLPVLLCLSVHVPEPHPGDHRREDTGGQQSRKHRDTSHIQRVKM